MRKLMLSKADNRVKNCKTNLKTKEITHPFLEFTFCLSRTHVHLLTVFWTFTTVRIVVFDRKKSIEAHLEFDRHILGGIEK